MATVRIRSSFGCPVPNWTHVSSTNARALYFPSARPVIKKKKKKKKNSTFFFCSSVIWLTLFFNSSIIERNWIPVCCWSLFLRFHFQWLFNSVLTVWISDISSLFFPVDSRLNRTVKASREQTQQLCIWVSIWIWIFTVRFVQISSFVRQCFRFDFGPPSSPTSWSPPFVIRIQIVGRLPFFRHTQFSSHWQGKKPIYFLCFFFEKTMIQCHFGQDHQKWRVWEKGKVPKKENIWSKVCMLSIQCDDKTVENSITTKPYT